MAGSRLTPHQLAGITAALTPQEQQVLATLARLRLATTPQLARLHFHDSTPRAAQRALAKLAALGLVTRLERRIGGIRAGSAGQVYSLDSLGQRLLPGGDRPPRRPGTPSLPFVSHRLAISELYVQLVEAERQGRLTLTHFTPEPECWQHFTAPHGGQLWLKPDADAVTAVGEYEDHWFIEIDCATESTLVIERKARRYLTYLASGHAQRTRGVFPRVLFVVPTARRARLLEQTLSHLPPTEAAVFRVTLAEEAVAVIEVGAL